MKKAITLILAAMMITGLVSCDKKDKDSSSAKENTSSSVSDSTAGEESSKTDEESSVAEESSKAEENSEASDSSQAGTEESADSPLAILNTIWATYEEAEMFPVVGGDFSEENANMEGPGRYSIADAEALDSALGFPAASIAKLEDAASIVHMMNANTFTCGAYRVKADEDLKVIADEIKANITARQWMCGIPEKYVIIALDKDIICAFGVADIVDVFAGKVKTSFASAETLVEDNIA